MSFFTRYLAYLRDNPKGYWFRRKQYGWGWTPATWQGWLTLTIFLAIFVWRFVLFLDGDEPTNAQTVRFVIEMLLWAVALIGVCAATGEPPRWQWGIHKITDKRK